MALFEEIKTIQKNVDQRKLKFIGGNNGTYDFSGFKTFNDLTKDLYSKKMSIDDAEKKQDEFNVKLNALNRYFPRNEKYMKQKISFQIMHKPFLRRGRKLLKSLKKEYFC